MRLECEHGQLARSCNLCEYEAEIVELAGLLREAQVKLEASERPPVNLMKRIQALLEPEKREC